MNPYLEYYEKQAKTGVGICHNAQLGHGIGNWLASLYRSVMPLLRSGLSALKTEVIDGGIGILSDTLKQLPIKESLQNRVRTAGNNLTEKIVRKVGGMTGSGKYKRKAPAKSTQSKSKTKKRKVSTKNKKPKKTKKKPTKKTKTKAKKATKKPAKGKKNKVCQKYMDIFA